MALTIVSCRQTGEVRQDDLSDVPETVPAVPVVPVIPGFDSYTEVIPDSDISIEMQAIPGGTFMMGRPAREDGKMPHEGPQREVRVDDFWMSMHLITWSQYDLFLTETVEQLQEELRPEILEKLGTDSDAFSFPSPAYGDKTYGMGEGQDGYPAISITHFAAVEYAKWLSVKTGQFYRLATEAEWEYACRAGSKAVYAHGSDDPLGLDAFEWHRDNSSRSYQKVGQKKPNAFGLHDMQGNLSEWVIDQFFEDYHERLEGDVAENPVFFPDKLYPRSVRGGSWRDDPADIRCTTRRGSTVAWSRGDPQIPRSMWWHTNAPFVGFRLVRPRVVPEPEEAGRFWIDPMLDI